MFNANNRPGQFYQTHKRRMMNRNGAAVVVGSVLAVDILGTATETAAGVGVGGVTGLDVQDAIFHNAVQNVTGNLWGPKVVVTSLLSGAGADNTELEVALCGQRVPCLVDGTSDIAVGDPLIAANTTDALIVAAQAAASSIVAIALQAYTDTTEVVKDVIFFGCNMGIYVDDT